MGKAGIGFGQASGENRAIQAAELAIADPLLDDTNLSSAGGVLITITGGEGSTLFEVDEAACRVREEFGDSARVVFGWLIDTTMADRLSVSVVVVARYG